MNIVPFFSLIFLLKHNFHSAPLPISAFPLECSSPLKGLLNRPFPTPSLASITQVFPRLLPGISIKCLQIKLLTTKGKISPLFICLLRLYHTWGCLTTHALDSIFPWELTPCLSQLLPLSLPRSRWNIKVIMPLGFCGGSDSKASARNVRDPGSIPVSGGSPGEGNGNPLQYSCLENSMVGGAWWATVHGVTKSQTWLSDFSLTHSLLCPWSFTWILWTPYLSPPFHFWTPSSIFPPNHPFTHAVPAFRLLKLALIQSQFFILGIPNDYFSVINFLDLQAVDHVFYLFFFLFF